MTLNEKQKRFGDEYLIDLNATQAAVRAGYSEKTAYSAGQRLLKHVEVQEYIARRMSERAGRTEITQDMVLQELAKVGFSDLRNVFSRNGGILDPQAWDDETAGAISSIEVVRRQSGEYDEDGNPIPEHVHKIKVWDKVSALEKMGKHLGMFVDRVEDVTPPERKAESATEVARAVALVMAKAIQDAK